MGRPPLAVKPFLVRLTDEQRQRIIDAVGPHRMAAFIRDAVDEKLERVEREKASSTKDT